MKCDMCDKKEKVFYDSYVVITVKHKSFIVLYYFCERCKKIINNTRKLFNI